MMNSIRPNLLVSSGLLSNKSIRPFDGARAEPLARRDDGVSGLSTSLQGPSRGR